MQFWNHIINTALLGTAKKPAHSQDFPVALQAAAAKILSAETLDREEQLLHLAAVAYNYRQSGTQPETGHVAPVTLCAAEDKAYCPQTAMKALQQALDTDSPALLLLWLQYCTAANLLVPPDDIPVLLDKAYKNKSLRNLVAACCGKRGEWLAQYNREWNFSVVADTIEERWQNGTTPQRVEALKELRETDPAAARVLLEATWSKENAAAKTALIVALQIQLGEEDIPWLQSLLQEKSKQVKEEVLLLLKKLPGSDLHEMYWQVLTTAIRLTETATVSCTFPQHIAETIYKSGIQPLSNDKKISDETFVLHQLIQRVHPSGWSTYFNLPQAEVIRFFEQQETLKPFVDALVGAVIWFEDRSWATSFIHNSEAFYIDLLPLLPADQQDLLSEKYFDQHPEDILRYADKRTTEWGMPLCRKILQYCANHPYNYNQTFMNNAIRHIPVDIVAELEHIVPVEAYQAGYWQNIRTHLEQLINSKSLIYNTFKPLLHFNN